MASHLVVIDSTARRYTVKTTPNKTLSEVLEEACGKIGLDSAQYGLKYNNKQLDLSRTTRLSGLSSGSKLELVQTSKSAGVVSVALQLPESQAQGVPNGRLTDKFPSTTTLWLVLRKFEAGAAGGTTAKNLTAQGAPSTNAGAGRLFYQQPVIQVMGRELSSFTDLQKTLAQLGFNSGSTLMRLTFRPSETPLEEALTQIQGYFDSVGAQAPAPAAQQPAPAAEVDEISSNPEPPTTEKTVGKSDNASVPTLSPSIVPVVTESTDTTPQDLRPGNRPVSVFAPPTSSTPIAALAPDNDSDYTPTVEHAQIHQKLLQRSSVNRRLPTDAELAAQASAEAEKLAAIKEIEIKIRYPDQSAVSAKFGQTDTASSLYSFARDCLEEKWQSEAFLLRNPGVRGSGEIIPDANNKLLIKDIQLKGRVLVIFGWDEDRASVAARGTKQVLKTELRQQAQEIKPPPVPTLAGADDDKGTKVNTGRNDDGGGADDGPKKKLPKWLKGLGGKK